MLDPLEDPKQSASNLYASNLAKLEVAEILGYWNNLVRYGLHWAHAP